MELSEKLGVPFTALLISPVFPFNEPLPLEHSGENKTPDMEEDVFTLQDTLACPVAAA